MKKQSMLTCDLKSRRKKYCIHIYGISDSALIIINIPYNILRKMMLFKKFEITEFVWKKKIFDFLDRKL